MHEAFNRKRWQQIDCSGLPCPLPGHLPNPGIEPRSSALQVDSLPAEPQGKPMLLLLSHFSRVRLCETPQMAAHKAPHPWDSPGKNTRVGCHFLLQYMKVKSESEVAQSCPTLHDPMTAAYQVPLSMGFSRQEYWSGVPLSSPSEKLSNLLRSHS